jgi:hypothetical protein
MVVACPVIGQRSLLTVMRTYHRPFTADERFLKPAIGSGAVDQLKLELSADYPLLGSAIC